jgi:hypothetical protein
MIFPQANGNNEPQQQSDGKLTEEDSEKLRVLKTDIEARQVVLTNPYHEFTM